MTKTTLLTCSLMLASGCAGSAGGSEPTAARAAASTGGSTSTGGSASTENTREGALRAGRLDAVLAGKTHRGAAGPNRYALYFAPDGTTRGRMGETELLGRWTREGEDTFCIEWQSPPLPRGCTYVVWPDGQDGTAYDAGTGELRNTIDALIDGEQTEL